MKCSYFCYELYKLYLLLNNFYELFKLSMIIIEVVNTVPIGEV